MTGLTEVKDDTENIGAYNWPVSKYCKTIGYRLGTDILGVE